MPLKSTATPEASFLGGGRNEEKRCYMEGGALGYSQPTLTIPDWMSVRPHNILSRGKERGNTPVPIEVLQINHPCCD